MKTIKYQVNLIFSNGNNSELGIFNVKEEAEKLYNSELKKDGYKPDDLYSLEIELNELLYDDNHLYDIETLESQTLYNSGLKDRYNYKGNNALDFNFECFWRAEKQELEYLFWLHDGDEIETVFESELSDWYY